MIQKFLIYFVIGALLAWPAWKLIRALIYRTGFQKTRGICFEAYAPTEKLNLVNHSGPDHV